MVQHIRHKKRLPEGSLLVMLLFEQCCRISILTNESIQADVICISGGAVNDSGIVDARNGFCDNMTFLVVVHIAKDLVVESQPRETFHQIVRVVENDIITWNLIRQIDSPS
jgi:hypothetical protein